MTQLKAVVSGGDFTFRGVRVLRVQLENWGR